MARRKADNTVRDQYATLKAAELAASLICSAENDVADIDHIILEAVGEATWDDIVLSYDSNTHLGAPKNWQVKRQTTALCKKTMVPVFRGMLDRARSGRTVIPEFYFGLDTLTDIVLREGHENRLHVLRDFCDKLRNPAINYLLLIEAADSLEHEWINYISAVTSLPERNQILDLLKHLHIKALGSSADIREKGTQFLAEKYEHPDKVFESLYEYLVVNTDPAFRFDYQILSQKVLSEHVKSYKRLPWIGISQARPNGEWILRGTILHSEVVQYIWPDLARPACLKLDLRPSQLTEGPENVLVRLLAHRAGATQLELDSSEEWRRRLERLCGGTLGSGRNVRVDFGAVYSTAPGRSSVNRTSEQPEVVALRIADQMDETFDRMVRSSVEQGLRNPATFGLSVQGDLLKSMATEWTRWSTSLQEHGELRKHFYQSLLSTESEWHRRGFDRSVRMGPINVHSCSRAIFVGLAIAAATNGAFQLAPIDGIANLLFRTWHCQLIALEHVSSSDMQEPMRIEYASTEVTIGYSALTILAGTTASADELSVFSDHNSHPYSTDGRSAHSYQNLYTRPALLTAGPDLARAMRSGASALASLVATAIKSIAGADLPPIDIEGDAYYA